MFSLCFDRCVDGETISFIMFLVSCHTLNLLDIFGSQFKVLNYGEVFCVIFWSNNKKRILRDFLITTRNERIMMKFLRLQKNLMETRKIEISQFYMKFKHDINLFLKIINWYCYFLLYWIVFLSIACKTLLLFEFHCKLNSGH